ncbi:hypothetical protein FJY90_01170 [Candidatus Gottesmanbacteria bacterium]|nr:hypothetical protein [Candidatus Gottesmanbacteria bacterium]
MRNYSKFCWPIFFFLLGAISLLAQAALLREVSSLFYGNEMFYGLGLGLWLLFTGAGSLFSFRFKLIKQPLILWASLIILAVLMPVAIILLRWIVTMLIPVGQLPDLWFSLVFCGLVFFIFCFPLGMEFTLATVIWSKSKRKKTTNLGYFWETAGFTTAGLLFSFILSSTSFPLPSQLDKTSLSWRYPHLVQATNSRLNQLVVTRDNQQYNFFVAGQLAFSSQDKFADRQLISLIAPFTQGKSSFLVLGNPTLASEIKNNLAPNSLDFLEIDDKLLEFEKELLITGVNPLLADPRRFLAQSKNQYDLIFVSLGNPQTLLSNRYYTYEFFLQIKRALTSNGIFVLTFYIPTDYQSQEAIRFAASIYQSLKAVFPSLELFTPEDQLIFATSQNRLMINKNNIDPFRQDYFFYQMDNPKRRQILSNLSAANVKLNLDSDPIAFFYQQLFWQTMFNFKLPGLLVKSVNILPLFILIILLISFFKLKKQQSFGPLMAISSFILMSLEVIIIFMFQAKIGYLYSQISLIFAAVMSGMAIGVIAIRNFKDCQWAFKISFLGYLIIISLFLCIGSAPITMLPIFWLGIAFVSGLSGGMSFASLTNLYLKNRKHPGYIYAFDLFGGSLGAILTSGILLPFFGLKGLTLGLLAVVLVGLIAKLS